MVGSFEINLFIQFPLNNMILIAGNEIMISFDAERCVLQKTDIQFYREDYFKYAHNGVQVENEMFLVGDKHLYFVDLTTNQTNFIRNGGCNWDIIYGGWN